MKNKYGFEAFDDYSNLVGLAVALYEQANTLRAGPQVEASEKAYLEAYAALLETHLIDYEPEIMAWDAYYAYIGTYDQAKFTHEFSTYISHEFNVIPKSEAKSRANSYSQSHKYICHSAVTF